MVKYKIRQEIIKDIKSIVGDFDYELIYTNPFQKNFVYLIKTGKKKFILKLKNNSKFPKKEIRQEVNGREKLKEIFKKARITNYSITKIVDYDLNDLWILFEYAKFENFYEIFKKDKNKFRSIIIDFYKKVITRLLKNVRANTTVPGEFGMNDIGYSDGKFYFFDLEVTKELTKEVTDIYAKLIREYLKSIKKNIRENAVYLGNLISQVKKIQEPYLNKEKFNFYLSKRLKTDALAEFLSKKDFDKIYQKFKY